MIVEDLAILDTLTGHGPATVREIAGWLQMHPPAVHRRLIRLQRDGEARRTGKRLDTGGRPAWVWEVTP